MDLLAEGITGGIGGFFGRAVAFPFDTLKVKLATQAGSSLAAAVRRVLEQEGVLGFYHGIHFSMIEATYQKFLYVFLFSSLKRFFRRISGKDMMVTTILSGYLSDLTCVPFSMPIEAMVVQLQSASSSTVRSAAMRKAMTWEGILASVRTGRAYLVLSLKAGLEFALFEKFKSIILRSRRGSADLPPLVAFALGAVARALATMATYPYARGKALCQAQLAPSAFAGVKEVYRTEGFLALYRGVSMDVTRGMVQSAVMFAVMERIRVAVHGLVLPSDHPGRQGDRQGGR